MFIRNYTVEKMKRSLFCALTATIGPHTDRLAKPLKKKGGGLEDLATRVQLTREIAPFSFVQFFPVSWAGRSLVQHPPLQQPQHGPQQLILTLHLGNSLTKVKYLTQEVPQE